MSAATVIAQAFGEGANLYTDVLETSPEATQAQLRKAYYTKALLYHPDKAPGNEALFQAISVAYEILKDPERRAEYDDSGELCDEEDINTTDVSAWKSFFRHQFGTITASDIDKFAAKYKCSPEEEGDVLKEYTKFKGNVLKMLDCVMLSEPRDAERWVEDYIRPAIRDGRVDDYGATVEMTLKQAFTKVHDEDDDREVTEGEEGDVIDEDATESDDSGEIKKLAGGKKKASPKRARPTRAKAKKRTKKEREADAAQELMAKIQGKNALARRKEDFNTMFAGIQQRYGVTDEDPLAGQDFDKVQAQLLGKKSKTKK
jgi:curved DNA-binding protein CbpA